MQNYAAGWNMVGYGDDPDNIYVTDEWESAVTYLADMVNQWWDQEYDMDDLDTSEKLRIDSRYIPIHSELHNMPTGPEWHGVVADSRGYDYHFWIVPTDEPVEV